MKQSPLSTLPSRGLAALVAGAFALALTSAPAHADFYHTVAKGDTLASVASRYNVSPETLRSLNKLDNSSFDAALPQMLLRVPDDEGRSSAAASAPAPAPAESTEGPRQMSGTISRSLTYTVQKGDTWATIATRHAEAGYAVTTDSLRRGNPDVSALVPGDTITVPLGTSTFRAPAPTQDRSALRTISSGDSDQVDGATVSAEMPGNTWTPVAKEIPRGQPVYKDPVGEASASPRGRAAKSEKPETRGPSVLASRGAMGAPTIDGVRVLSQGEDAPSEGRTPRPHLSAVPRPARTRAVPAQVAHVAKIASNDARIRRLPDADAATLYHCAMGTEIAVIKQSGPWAAILMSDRSTGWVPTRYLSMTGQSVDITGQVITDTSRITENQNFAVGGHFSSNNRAVAEALTYLGTPYVYGGESRHGIDCSSLVQHAFAACGVRLPRTAAEQARVGTPVNPAQLQAGDRLYFSASGTRIDHTGLYMGDGYFVQASGRGRGVIVSRLADRRNWNIFVAARR